VPLALDLRGVAGVAAAFFASRAAVARVLGRRVARRRARPVRSSMARRNSSNVSAMPSASGQASGTASRHTMKPKWMPPQ